MNEDSNGLMRRFHTSTRNEDIEDLYVDFNDKMDPMSFMQIVSSKDLYVIGHGEAEEDYRGSVFYSKYTLFTGSRLNN